MCRSLWQYVPSIKISLLSAWQIYMHGYSTLFEKRSWNLVKGSRLIVKGTKKRTLYCLHGKSLMSKFIDLAKSIHIWNRNKLISINPLPFNVKGRHVLIEPHILWFHLLTLPHIRLKIAKIMTRNHNLRSDIV